LTTNPDQPWRSAPQAGGVAEQRGADDSSLLQRLWRRQCDVKMGDAPLQAADACRQLANVDAKLRYVAANGAQVLQHDVIGLVEHARQNSPSICR
jgi:hypothetical protein